MHITQDIRYVGVNDHKIDLFESQYTVRNGMAYNSYVILDEKIAVLDTVDNDFKDEWLNNVKTVLGDRKPDYLVVHHMEPDHSSNILEFVKEYPKGRYLLKLPGHVVGVIDGEYHDTFDSGGETPIYYWRYKDDME